MFVKNLYKIEQDKMTKLISKKIEEKINGKEIVYLGFQDKFFIPKSNKSLEIIHSDSNKTSTMLRLVRDKPNLFYDYLIRDEIKANDEQIAVIKSYYSNKKIIKTLKNSTKLDLMEHKNNIKSISNRLKKSYIIQEKTDIFIKNLDLDDVVFIVNTKNFETIDFLSKSRNASKIIFKTCSKNLKGFFTENKFEELHKNVFF